MEPQQPDHAYRHIDRRGRTSEKWNWVYPPLSEHPEPFVLTIADMDFALSKDVQAEIVEKLSDPDVSLCYAVSDQTWRDTVSKWIFEESGCHIDKTLLAECGGVFQFMSTILDMLVGENNSYVILTPVCDIITHHAIYAKRRIIQSRLLLKQGKFEINYQQLEHLIARDDVKLFIFVNPTGRVWSQQEIEKVVTIIERTGKVLLSDEIYSSLAFTPHITLLKYADRLKDNLIVCNSPSKSFNVSGSGCGYGIMPNKKLLREYEGIRFYRYNSYTTLFSLVTLRACYTHGKSWLEQTKQYLLENIGLVAQTFKHKFKKATVFVPEAGYAILIDFAKYGLTSEEILTILRKHNIVISSMNCFFAPHVESSLFRIAVGCNRQYLQRFLVRLEVAFADIDQASNKRTNTQ